MARSRNIYEQQQRNRRLTWFIMVVFALFLGFIGLGFDFFYFGSDPFGIAGGPFTFPLASSAALIFGGGMSVWGLHQGAAAVLASAGALPASDGKEEHRTLLNVVEEMSIAAGLPRPRVYVIPDPDPNAFATGKDPQHSHIAVTRGLLETLNREELQGVIAHEMSHVRNYDIRLMTVIAALVGAVLLISDWARRAMRVGGMSRQGGSRSRASRGKGGAGLLLVIVFAVWLLAVVLAPIISQLLAMAVSRQREYLADASAAELTRNPLALARALERLESAAAPTRSVKRSSAHLCIIDPLGRRANFREGRLADLLATHPPLARRITRLKAMAYQPAATF